LGDTAGTDRVDLAIELLRRLDPGGVQSLQAHRVDTSPMLNVLLVPSDRSLRADRMYEFSRFVREDYGAEIYRLIRLDPTPVEQLEEQLHDRRQVTGTATVAEAIEWTHEQLLHSYVASIEIPNPRQDGARRDLRFELEGSRHRLTYMPYYTSSRPMAVRFVDYLNSPFKGLRVLSAYELRRHWRDEQLMAAWAERWKIESDSQVRTVLFESWIVAQLERLQASDGTRRGRLLADEAFAELRRAADAADELPSPDLARDALLLAQWYRLDRGRTQPADALRGDGGLRHDSGRKIDHVPR
jgi:hypothetical protein